MSARNKFNARPVKAGERADGLSFDSREEARQYDFLRLRERIGEIVAGSIRLQVRYRLEVNGVHVCDYVADFVCRETAAPDVDIVIDAKGVRTREYLIKKKLMAACFAIAIREVGRKKDGAAAGANRNGPGGRTRRGAKAMTKMQGFAAMGKGRAARGAP